MECPVFDLGKLLISKRVLILGRIIMMLMFFFVVAEIIMFISSRALDRILGWLHHLGSKAD